MFSKITGGSLFSLWKRVLEYFRKFRLVSTVLRVTTSILTILGTGAFFIFIYGALVFIVPLIIGFCAALYFFGTVSRTRALRELEKRLSGKRIYVFFPKKDRPFERGSAFRQTIELISSSEKEQNFIIIVSPYLFSAVGVSGDFVKFYPVMRFESERICIIRRHSFFALRKRVLEPAESRTAYIY